MAAAADTKDANAPNDTKTKTTKKERQAFLEKMRLPSPLNGRCNGTIVNRESKFWDPDFEALPEFVLYAIAHPYTEVKVVDDKSTDKKKDQAAAREFFGSLQLPQLRLTLNTFFADRNPYYGTQRRFTTKDNKSVMLDFIVDENEFNTSVIRDAFLCWLMNRCHALYAVFWVV